MDISTPTEYYNAFDVAAICLHVRPTDRMVLRMLARCSSGYRYTYIGDKHRVFAPERAHPLGAYWCNYESVFTYLRKNIVLDAAGWFDISEVIPNYNSVMTYMDDSVTPPKEM